MNTKILELGYMELAACGKCLRDQGAYAAEETIWNPFPEWTAGETLVALRELILEMNQEPADSVAGRLRQLGVWFELSGAEQFVILLASLKALERGFGAVYQALGCGNGVPDRQLMQQVWESNHSDEETGFAVRWELLERYFLAGSGSGTGQSDEPVRLQSRIVNFLKLPAGAEVTVDAQWESILNLQKAIERVPEKADDRQRIQAMSEQIRRYLFDYSERDKKEVIRLCGPAGIGKRDCICRAVFPEGHSVLFVSEKELRLSEQLSVASVVREAVLTGACLCVEEESWDLHTSGTDRAGDGRTRSLLAEGLRLLPAVILVRDEEEPCGSRYPVFTISMKLPDMGERYQLWVQEAGQYRMTEACSFHEMANKYSLSPEQIRKVFALAWNQARYDGRDGILAADLAYGCHQLLKANFGSLAARVESTYRWDELVLPMKQKEKILAACHQMQYRHLVLEDWELGSHMTYGTGISLVFAGAPGTGKTMAAGILANELGVELYKVKLSAVVSKFIGETEKNLERIFDEAKRSQAALFFDEADVLFGKRTEVKDSNDKYSNMEAAFLLQRMEEYEGVTILATNLLKNMDEAFRRRMKFVVDFPFPDAGSRLEIWRRAIPEKLPKEELDLEFLAERFELSGSGIRNAVYQGSFLAAAGNGRLSMADLIRAVSDEYEKNGKTMSRQEAGPYGRDVEITG